MSFSVHETTKVYCIIFKILIKHGGQKNNLIDMQLMIRVCDWCGQHMWMETLVLVLHELLIISASFCVWMCVCVLQMAPQWQGLSFITISTNLSLFLLLKSNKSHPLLMSPPTTLWAASCQHSLIYGCSWSKNMFCLYKMCNFNWFLLSSVFAELCWTVKASGEISLCQISQETFSSQVIKVNSIHESTSCQRLKCCSVYNPNMSHKSSPLSPLSLLH